MASRSFSYDHPNYTTIRQEVHSAAVATAGLQTNLTFRSRVACVITGIGAVLGSVSSVTLLLTLLHNGSVMAILTLSNSANEVARQFTLAANRTLTSLTDRLEVHAAKDKGKVSIVYEYRIVPDSTYSLATAI